MIGFRVQDGLPFVEAKLVYGNREIRLPNALIDTGSARSVFAADKVAEIGVALEPQDAIHRIAGVDGTEFVFTKTIDLLALDTISKSKVEIEIGAMDYGFPIDGILGNDFLLAVGAIIDMKALEIRLAV